MKKIILFVTTIAIHVSAAGAPLFQTFPNACTTNCMVSTDLCCEFNDGTNKVNRCMTTVQRQGSYTGTYLDDASTTFNWKCPQPAVKNNANVIKGSALAVTCAAMLTLA